MAKSRIRDIKEKMRESNPDIIQFLETKYIVKDRPNDGPFAVINGVKTEWNIRLRCIIIGIGTHWNFPALNKLLSNNSFPDIKIETSYGGFIRFCNFNYERPASSIECFKKFVKILESTKLVLPEDHAGLPKARNSISSEQRQNGCVQLTNEETEKLNSFCGHGKLHDAEILFFGDEEGLDGDNIQTVIAKRCKEAEENHCLDGSDYRNGHYHFSEVYEGNGNTIQMIMFQARILLYLNDPNGDWFSEKKDNEDAFIKIRDYHWNNIYIESSEWKYKTALTELRPLARRDEEGVDKWPYSNIDYDQYIKAFRFGRGVITDKNIIKLLEDRCDILYNVFSKCPKIKVIVGIGDRESKMRFFKKIFREIDIDEFYINSKKFYHAKVKIENRTIDIFLCNFFGGRGKYKLHLADLPGLAKGIKDVLDNRLIRSSLESL